MSDMDNWISVLDELPEKNVWVRVVGLDVWNNKRSGMARFDRFKGWHGNYDLHEIYFWRGDLEELPEIEGNLNERESNQVSEPEEKKGFFARLFS